MKIERLTKREAAEAMGAWTSDTLNLPFINKEYEDIRNDLSKLFIESKLLVDEDVRSYRMDIVFGVSLYDYLNTKAWFNLRLASDDGFWRFLSLKVAPNLVGERWGNDNGDHYYSKPNRIWFKTIWWFVFLSIQDAGIQETKRMLLSDKFSTDTILNLVERTGHGGTNVALYREIIKRFHQLSNPSEKDFRKIMKLNTAKAVVIEPTFYEGGISGYVSCLFRELSLM